MKKSAGTRRSPSQEAAASGVASAVVAELSEPGRVDVRLVNASRGGELVRARVAQIAGYRPTVGDRVLVAREGDDRFVIAVIHAATPPALVLPDGAAAQIDGEALVVRDPAGRVLVRYAQGAAEIAPAEGDLRLSAPNGRVVLSSGLDVSIEAARDVVHHAGRRVDLGAGADGRAPAVRVEPDAAHVKVKKLEVEAKSSRVVTGEAQVLARSIATTAERIAIQATRYELTATRLVEQTRDAFRDVADLAQSRIGRLRTIVKDVCSVHTRRTVMVSKEDTSIDGKKILLG